MAPVAGGSCCWLYSSGFALLPWLFFLAGFALLALLFWLLLVSVAPVAAVLLDTFAL